MSPGVHLYKKVKGFFNIGQAWWHTSVIPATWEAEAGGLLEAQEVEAAVSCDRTTALQPGQQSKTLSQRERERDMHTHIYICVYIYIRFREQVF